MQIRFVILLFLTWVAWEGCGPTPKEADRYNRQLTAWQHEVKVAADSLEKSFFSFDTVHIESALKQAEKLAKQQKSALEKEAYLGGRDSLLYLAHKAYLDVLSDVLNHEYAQMLDLYRIPDEEYGLEGEKKFRELQKNKNQKLKKAFLTLKEAQDEFAGRYNLILKKKVE